MFMSESEIFIQKRNTNPTSSKREARLRKIINDFTLYCLQAEKKVKKYREETGTNISVVHLKKEMIEVIGKSFNRNHYYFNALLYLIHLGLLPSLELDLETGFIKYGKKH